MQVFCRIELLEIYNIQALKIIRTGTKGGGKTGILLDISSLKIPFILISCPKYKEENIIYMPISNVLFIIECSEL